MLCAGYEASPVTVSFLPSSEQYDVHCTYLNTVAKAPFLLIFPSPCPAFHAFYRKVVVHTRGENLGARLLIFSVCRFNRSFLFLMTLGIPAHVDTHSFLFLMTLGIPAHVDTHSAFEDGIISISLGSQVICSCPFFIQYQISDGFVV